MIGVDIGTKFIKLCRAEKRGDGYRIVSAVMASHPPAVDGRQQNGETVSRLKTLIRETLPPCRSAVASVGSSQIVARNFAFPRLSPDELKGAVRLEAEQSIFSDLSTMYSDSLALSNGDKDKAEILFVAVPKDIVDRQLQVIQDAGLDAVAVDIDNLALANCFLAFNKNADKESVVLLDIGHQYTNIVVIDDGNLRFVRNVAFGGKDISAEIAACFGIATEMAEEIKKRPAVWGDIGLNIKNVLRKSMPDLLEAVYRSIEYCMSRKKLINVDRILLTGGTSGLQGIDGFISDVLGMPAQKWNPLDAVEIPGTVRKDFGQFLGVALGLAIRDGHHA